MYGVILAGIFVVIEMFLHNLKISVKEKSSLKKALLEEIKFYFKFGENVKPLSADEDDGSGEEKIEGEEEEQKGTPPPLGFILEDKPQQNGTNGSPYGFVFDRKSEEDSGGSKSRSKKSNGRSNTQST